MTVPATAPSTRRTTAACVTMQPMLKRKKIRPCLASYTTALVDVAFSGRLFAYGNVQFPADRDGESAE